MGRPPALRPGPRVDAFLESLRNGSTRTAACAAAGVSTRAFERHMNRAPAFREQVEDAESEAERRMTSVVVDAAVGGDVKAAMFWLERRRPSGWRQSQEIDARVQEVDPELMIVMQRISAMPPEEIVAEARRMAWAGGTDPENDEQALRRTSRGDAAMPSQIPGAGAAGDTAPHNRSQEPPRLALPEGSRLDLVGLAGLLGTNGTGEDE